MNWSQFSTRKLRRLLQRKQRKVWNYLDFGYNASASTIQRDFRAIRAELERRGEFVG